MNKLALATLLCFAFGCDEEEKVTAEQAALRDECKQLLVHVVKISPYMKDALAGKSEAEAEQIATARAAKLPVEEVQQCTAAEPEIRECMAKATDIAGIKKCVPSGDILACMAKAQKVPDIRAKCWAGDAKAADGIKD